MFKKLKDKLAEEVKSSPQRIQQFAQAAQAAVTSASSSISDITNNDLFSIGGDETPQNSPAKTSGQGSTQKQFQNISLNQSLSHVGQPHGIDPSGRLIDREATPTNEMGENHRGRKLSTSSIASDVSFRLPSYESPSMYHLQSDMDVSASEAEERGLASPGGAISLERVTKDQLYAAYRRTLERYGKYRARYGDLARHYKLLERENAKARSVLVETQDKALRRISELREQCALEQSAKAHLENALRVDLDERNLTIDALNTKIKLLQSYGNNEVSETVKEQNILSPSDPTTPSQNLIDLSTDEKERPTEEVNIPENQNLTNKVQKMEQLLTKYKGSLKTFKEKNSQLTTEIQILSKELEKKERENEQLEAAVKHLAEARQQIHELKETNQEMQSKLNDYNSLKENEISALKLVIEKSSDEIRSLNNKIEVFSKREEEYAISLAENKLSIHKELESKESEIKMLKDKLEAADHQINSIGSISENLKQSLNSLEQENTTLTAQKQEIEFNKNKVLQLEAEIKELKKQCQSHDLRNAKASEEYKCLELQLKQETAEKLAMVDRNNYLETRNKQFSEDSSKKIKHIVDLEKEISELSQNQSNIDEVLFKRLEKENSRLENDLDGWKNKYFALESEIQEERDELVKLQSEIEKLLVNHEQIQTENEDMQKTISILTLENQSYRDENKTLKLNLSKMCGQVKGSLNGFRLFLSTFSNEIKAMQMEVHEQMAAEIQNKLQAISHKIKEDCDFQLNNLSKSIVENNNEKMCGEISRSKEQYKNLQTQYISLENKLQEIENSLQMSLNNIQALETEKSDLLFKIKELENDKNYEAEKLHLEEQNRNLVEQNEVLKSKADEIVESVKDLERELTEVKESHNKIVNEKNELLRKIEVVESDLLNTTEKEQTLHMEALKKIKELEQSIEKLKSEKHTSALEKIQLQEELDNAVKDIESKAEQLNNFESNNEIWQQKLATILEENNLLHEKCERLKQEKEIFHEKTLASELKAADSEKKLNQQKESVIETEFLNLRISQLESDLKLAKSECVRLQEAKEAVQERMSEESHSKEHNIQGLNDSVTKLQNEIKGLQTENLQLNKSIESEALEKSKLTMKIEEITNLADNKNCLNEKNIIDLQKEIDLKSDIITNLQKDSEISEQKDLLATQELQDLKTKEMLLIEKNQILTTESESIKEKISNLLELGNENQFLQEEIDNLKTDKNRLTSDIEGLQAHLAKVSKDNSLLNDKIREMMANDETLNEKLASSVLNSSQVNGNFEDYKDKLEDLERQNSILVEENLELQDQLKVQTVLTKENGNNNIHNSTEKDLELIRLKDKYNELLEAKAQLESRHADLELIGRSGDSNIQHLEMKNDKLKLVNEKLERRLDEALVSLRHLRALEESTELEYLKNILYEYLTGPGTHSLTLAKVLAAVVKFDERQTQLVLQREKERQGLLGQLGIL